jgi:hypothetical protein
VLARILSICLAGVLATVPLATLADGWVKGTGTWEIPVVYFWKNETGCRLVQTHASQRTAEASCPSRGEVIVGQRHNGKKCIVNIWSTGVFATTWHAEFLKNEGHVCSFTWGGENTVLLTIKNDLRD